MGHFLKHGQIEFVRMVVRQAYNGKEINKLQTAGQIVRTNSICPCYFFMRKREEGKIDSVSQR